MLILGAVRRYEKSFALHRAHTEDRINLLSSRLNDLSLVVSDTNQASYGFANFVLTIPETIFGLVGYIFMWPRLILKRILLGLVERKDVIVNKGKMTRVSKSPTKKRVTGGKLE